MPSHRYHASFNGHVLSTLFFIPNHQNALLASVSLQQTHFFMNNHALSSNTHLHYRALCLFTVITFLLIITLFMINKVCLRINILHLTVAFLHRDSSEISHAISKRRTKILLQLPFRNCLSATYLSASAITFPYLSFRKLSFHN